MAAAGFAGSPKRRLETSTMKSVGDVVGTKNRSPSTVSGSYPERKACLKMPDVLQEKTTSQLQLRGILAGEKGKFSLNVSRVGIHVVGIGHGPEQWDWQIRSSLLASES